LLTGSSVATMGGALVAMIGSESIFSSVD
jgi:hypothetical protein